MAKKSKTPAVPGDIRIEVKDYSGEQPLTQEQKALVQRMLELFRFFYDKHRAEHIEMAEARKIRQLRHEERAKTAPPSTALLSSIDNVIADQIDNMPEAVLVPEREETANSAEEMTDIVSYVLYQAGWPGKYHTLMEDAAVVGTGIAEVLWDEDASDGEGLANILVWHPEDFYPDPQYENIQNGRAVFKTTHTTVAWVEEHYPDAKGYVREDEYTREGERAIIEAPAGDQKVTLIECWYKRYCKEKRRYYVHMAQIAGGALLYSTELDFGVERKGEYREGVYAHGQYPFTFFRYRDVYGQPFGTGLVHDYKDTQNAIDRYLKYIDDNARESSVQRKFIREGAVLPEDVADLSKTVVTYKGSDIRQDMTTVQANPINSQVYQMTVYLSDTMKQDSGQNQFARGEGGLGVTAATAIQSLQEAGGKITRMHTDKFKDAFREVVEQVLWVLSEYMEPKRKLRIVGGWDSTGIMKDRVVEIVAPKAEGDKLPKPAYHVRVEVQKRNPLEYLKYNELLTQAAQVCAQYGNPLPPEVFIGLLQGYPNKGGILKAVQANSQIQQQMQQMQAEIQQLNMQLEQQKKANAGYLKALSTPGGGAAQQEQQAQMQPREAPNYNKLTQAIGEEVEVE